MPAQAGASRSLDKAEAWARAHEVPKAYGSYEALLDDPDIDAVYIPLPTAMHKEWTVKAAAKGKHVLIEKPVGRNAAEAVEMVDACEAAGVQLMDGEAAATPLARPCPPPCVCVCVCTGPVQA